MFVKWYDSELVIWLYTEDAVQGSKYNIIEEMRFLRYGYEIKK